MTGFLFLIFYSFGLHYVIICNNTWYHNAILSFYINLSLNRFFYSVLKHANLWSFVFLFFAILASVFVCFSLPVFVAAKTTEVISLKCGTQFWTRKGNSTLYTQSQKSLKKLLIWWAWCILFQRNTEKSFTMRDILSAHTDRSKTAQQIDCSKLGTPIPFMISP